MTEHVLPYDRSIVPQETGWDCGPASTQVVLNSLGVIVSERDLIAEIGSRTLEEFDAVLALIRRLDGVTSSETSLMLTTRRAGRR